MNPPTPVEQAGRPTRRVHRGRRGGETGGSPGRIRFRFRPRLIDLEDRTLPSTFLVDTTADTGPGSLRQAILDSNTAPGSSTIDFALAGQGLRTIVPASPLPPITGTLLIDGTSQPGYAGSPLIQMGVSQAALTLAGPGVTVRGLAMSGLAVITTGDDRLTAQVVPHGITTSLALADSQGRVLVQSDGASKSNPDDSIDEHLAAGSWVLEVDTIEGTGDATLTATLTPSSPPFQPIAITPSSPYGPMVIGDFNGDGISDLAVPDGIHAGLSDGTFQAPTAGLGLPAVRDENITAMIAGDFNGDGKLDLAVAYGSLGKSDPGGVYVLLGDGDGTCRTPEYDAAGDNPASLVAGDFNGDGKLDLAVVDKGEVASGTNVEGGVSVLLGNGDGTFQPNQELPEPKQAPQAIVAGDFSGSGQLELAVANKATNDVSILRVNGDGTLQQAGPALPVGATPYSLVAGDFNGDGRLDLAVANFVSDDVSVLLGIGRGVFQPAVSEPVGVGPQSLIAGDFLGDGTLDLALVDTGSDEVSILPGKGDGTFGTVEQTLLGYVPAAIVAGDFNGDGRLDAAIASSDAHSGIGMVAILLGEGIGSFQAIQPLAGDQPSSQVAGDFNDDGYVDLAAADTLSDSVSILLGHGDGTFQPAKSIALGFPPTAVVTGDFNGDGRLDLAIVGTDPGTNGGRVAVLLGNGDGTFEISGYRTGGRDATSVAVGDFNGDGRLDLAVANTESDTVSLLLGDGDGTYRTAIPYPAGERPVSLAVGDFNGDGRPDLAAADLAGGDVSLLLNRGDGRFQPPTTVAVGRGPESVVAGDFNGDGRLDLAVAASGSADVPILLGNGDGTFGRRLQVLPVGVTPYALVTSDLNGDGKLDLAVVDNQGNDVLVLLGDGQGEFREAAEYAVGAGPESLVVGDFNGDGRLDLTAADAEANDVSVLLGNGNGTFDDASQVATAPHATPLVADVNGDGTADVLVIDAAGDILYRQGRPQQPGTFAPPLTVNPGFPSRDIAWVPATLDGPLLASVDARDNAISLYAFRGGSFIRVGFLGVGQLPAQVIAADLTGDGWDDLVVRNAGDGTLSVYLNAGGNLAFQPVFVGPRNRGYDLFGLLANFPAGPGVSDVEAIDIVGDGRLDLVVTSKLSGQVAILFNRGNGRFAAPVPYRAGTALSAVDSSVLLEVTSLDAPAGVAGGPIAPGGLTNLVTINPGSNTLDILAGLGQGRFANPTSLTTRSPAQAIRMVDFSGDGADDLAVLTADGLNTYNADGKGGFLPPVTYAVGPGSTGLIVADVNHDGRPDLLIGDSYGDVLVLLGIGDGRFQSIHEIDQGIALAVADLSGNGSKDIIYADQGLNRVTVERGAGNLQVVADHLLEPGAVALADLNGDGILDLIVANSGGNDVLIYPGLGNGLFGPEINGGHGEFVGTDPIGITVANLTGARPDLVVADKGSNQVSILLNQSRQGGPIAFSAGPRLNSGGVGPVSTVVGDFSGGGFPDILVTNSGSNNVAILPGVGQGFFNDQAPRTYSVGSHPATSIVGNFDGQPDLVTVNTGTNDLTLISDFNGPDPAISTISSGGIEPVAAFAFDAGNGFEDLVVGNSGDASVSLFEGGADGLSLAYTQPEPRLPDLTDLALLAVASGHVEFFAVTAGLEAAQLLSLNLQGGPLSSFADNVLQLVPLRDSPLPLVATVVSLAIEATIEPASEEADLGMAATNTAMDVASPGAGISFGQGASRWLADLTAEGDGSERPIELGQSAGPAAPAASPSWDRFLFGIDEVLQKLRATRSWTALDQDDMPVGDRSGPPPGEPDSQPRDGPTSSMSHPDPLGLGKARDRPAVDAIIGRRAEAPPWVSYAPVHDATAIPWPLFFGAAITGRVRFTRPVLDGRGRSSRKGCKQRIS